MVEPKGIQKYTVTSDYKDLFFSQYAINRKKLSNGLTIIIQENHELPIASMFTFFKVGSRNEKPGITGISHLFEHMMFNGSRKYGPREFDRILEAGGGYSNAYTSKDMTVYYEDFASMLLETVLDLESDRMGWLMLTEESMTSERAVVKEERRMRTENSVLGRLEEELFAASFQCHPYRWPIIGWKPDIENISMEDCRNFFVVFYSPGNALIVLSGDIDSEAVFHLIEEKYGKIPKRETPKPTATKEPQQHGEKRIFYRKKSNLNNFLIGYHVPEYGNTDIYALDVLQIILTEGESSLMYRKLVREKGIVLSLYSDFTWHLDPGLFIFYFQMRPGFTSEEGEKAFDAELKRFTERCAAKKDIERAVAILEVKFINVMQSNNGRAHRLGLTDVFIGSYEKLFDPLEEYNKVTADDISSVLSKYFIEDNKTTVVLRRE